VRAYRLVLFHLLTGFVFRGYESYLQDGLFVRRRIPCFHVDMSYLPKPIDTSGVGLSADVLDLTERLAENTHDVWARLRFAQGWEYGPRRDDARKKHPCLVPYDQLPESEKEYDRNTAMESIKAILALGFRITRAPDATPSTKAPPPKTARRGAGAV